MRDIKNQIEFRNQIRNAINESYERDWVIYRVPFYYLWDEDDYDSRVPVNDAYLVVNDYLNSVRDVDDMMHEATEGTVYQTYVRLIHLGKMPQSISPNMGVGPDVVNMMTNKNIADVQHGKGALVVIRG